MPRKRNFVQPASQQFCGGKVRYPNKRSAETAAREQEMLQFSQDLHLNVYRCVNCGGWHLTSNDKNTTYGG